MTDHLHTTSQPVEFDNGAGLRLSGRLEHPVGHTPIAYALWAHCFTCSKLLRAVGRVTERLAGHGIATLRFDFTGLGSSEGEFGDTNFTSNQRDIEAAARYLTTYHRAPTLAIGHSLGGSAVLAASGRIDSINAVVTIGSPADPAHVEQHLQYDIDRIEAEGQADVQFGGRLLTVKNHFLDDIRSADLERNVTELGLPLLVMHSPIDQVVGVENAARIFASARHPKSFLSLDRADHLLTGADDADYVADVIAAWAGPYLSS